MRVNAFSTQQAQQEASLDKLRSERYTEIMAHERAHQSAAGQYAGAIHIVYDGNKVPISGYVPINIPALDTFAPTSSVAAGTTIRNAALAPSKPSSADKNVAGLASRLIAKAQQLLSLYAQNGFPGKAQHSIKPQKPFMG
jgi:SprA-related family